MSTRMQPGKAALIQISFRTHALCWSIESKFLSFAAHDKQSATNEQNYQTSLFLELLTRVIKFSLLDQRSREHVAEAKCHTWYFASKML